MKRKLAGLIILILSCGLQYVLCQNRVPANDSTSSLPVNEMQEDFAQFRNALENKHCCPYEYISKPEMDSLIS